MKIRINILFVFVLGVFFGLGASSIWFQRYAVGYFMNYRTGDIRPVIIKGNRVHNILPAPNSSLAYLSGKTSEESLDNANLTRAMNHDENVKEWRYIDKTGINYLQFMSSARCDVMSAAIMLSIHIDDIPAESRESVVARFLEILNDEGELAAHNYARRILDDAWQTLYD